jgi:hypothetical protein
VQLKQWLFERGRRRDHFRQAFRASTRSGPRPAPGRGRSGPDWRWTPSVRPRRRPVRRAVSDDWSPRCPDRSSCTPP